MSAPEQPDTDAEPLTDTGDAVVGTDEAVVETGDAVVETDTAVVDFRSVPISNAVRARKTCGLAMVMPVPLMSGTVSLMSSLSSRCPRAFSTDIFMRIGPAGAGNVTWPAGVYEL